MKVGIAGFGNIGRSVASALVKRKIAGAELVAVSGRDLDKARAAAARIDTGLRVVPVPELPALCDVVVEAATVAALPEIARAVVAAGKDLICISGGGLVQIPDIEDIAGKHGSRIQIASGTLPGLDILRSAAEGTIETVHLKSRLRPDSLANEPYLLDQGLDFRQRPPAEAVKVYEGTAREAATKLPRHLNIAVALSLAGIGFDRTTVELWVDPEVPGAVNQLEIRADEVDLTMVSRNFPSENPKTSRIVPLSILAALRARTALLRAGS